MSGLRPDHSIAGGLWLRFEMLFRSEEVDRDLRLKVIGGCLLFFFHMTFTEWWEGAQSLSTLGDEYFNAIPAPWVEGFRKLIFMDILQTRIYLYLLGMLALLGLFSLFCFRSSLPALCILAFLMVNKGYFYLSDVRLFANYHHFHLAFTLIFLLATDKLRFFRMALAVCYVMSGIVKLSPSWLMGEYYTSLPDKLPLLPKVDPVVVAACLGVVVLEFLGPLCWLTRIGWLRCLSFILFVGFHLYSGVIIGLYYTTLMLPLVLASFWGFREPLQAGYRYSRRHLVPFGILVLALFGGVYHYFIPGDVRLTAEGRYFGLFMVDANHSVRAVFKIRKGDKEWVVKVERRWQRTPGEPAPDSRIFCVYSQGGIPMLQFPVTQPIRDGEEIIFNPRYFRSARMRMSGDPYLYYHYARELVRRYDPDQVSVFMEQRLDGREESATLIDIDDFGAMDPSYHSLRRNEWILLP